MIRHIVLVRFAPGTTEAKIAGLWEELHQIEGQLPGLLGIASGQSESPEQIERGYMHGFTADFADWEALAAYQAHPDHIRFGQRLTAHAEGGRDGLLVFDLPVADR
ncbi:Dabb family protein [Roseivivax sp. GX 12232]|uniref:Dabb family protein n=1 Tax=Roseivivax sp. GX 12232 TaxID=2900547 RepID=UPI001E3DC51F|nr:Dabb family protein [Roseivivax sp. GX 12232]MCE0505047.1 Dabb family protein [Roseivivax sp. GX 12232]